MCHYVSCRELTLTLVLQRLVIGLVCPPFAVVESFVSLVPILPTSEVSFLVASVFFLNIL